jgi:hypothetical protein
VLLFEGRCIFIVHLNFNFVLIFRPVLRCGFNLQASIFLNTIQSHIGYTSWFLILAFCVICRNYILRSSLKILFYLVPPIAFLFRANPFLYLGIIRRWSWNGVCLKIPHRRFCVHCHKHTIVWDRWKLYRLLVSILSCAQPGGNNMHFHYCPWTGSIKSNLQYFDICSFRWLWQLPQRTFFFFYFP